MFDLGMMELLVIGVVALVVVGPKDLPGLFRTVGNFVGKMKGMAREFQRSMNDAAKSSGVDDVYGDVKSAAGGLKKATSFNPVDFNKDLKSMTKDAIKKNTLLDDEAKEAAVKKVDAPAMADAVELPDAAPKPKKPAAKKPRATSATGKKPAKKPAARKPVAKKPAAKPAAKPAVKKTGAAKPPAKKEP